MITSIHKIYDFLPIVSMERPVYLYYLSKSWWWRKKRSIYGHTKDTGVNVRATDSPGRWIPDYTLPSDIKYNTYTYIYISIISKTLFDIICLSYVVYCIKVYFTGFPYFSRVSVYFKEYFVSFIDPYGGFSGKGSNSF